MGRKSTINAIPIILTGIFILFSGKLIAQDSASKWGVGLLGGFPYGYFNEASRTTPVYGIALDYAVSPAYYIQLNAYKGHFKAADRNNYYGRGFDNDFFQLSARQQINLFELVNLHSVARIVDLNGFVGIGFINSNVKTSINTSIPGYEKWQGVNYKGNSIAYSFGGGLTFKFTPHIAFVMRYEYNLTNSDYIDGYRTVQSSQNIDQPRIGNDAFSFATAGISIRFGGHKSRMHKPVRPVVAEKESPEAKSLEQMEKLGLLVKNNTQNLQETNNQIRQTLEILTEFVKTTSENQNANTQAYSKRLQAQIDSLRTRQIKTDSLIALKEHVDSLIQIKQKEAAAKAKKQAEARRKTSYKYYIVADSYLDYDDASNSLTKLKSEGYSKALIISDQTNTYYLVVYTVMDDEKAANLMLKKIKSYQNPLAWLYKGRQ